MRSRPAVAVAVVLALGACSKKGPRDVGDLGYYGDLGSPRADPTAAVAPSAEPRTAAKPSPTGSPPRVLARASARAIATSKTHVYFGDAEDDTLYALAKTGAGEPARFTRRTAMPGAMAIDAGALVWVASPGDVVLRLPLDGAGGAPTTLRDRGIFTDVAADGGDVFVLEAGGAGGVLTRITGTTTARLASFEGAPRHVVVDDAHAFVVTASKVLRAPRQRGELETVATGAGFAAAAMDEKFVYVTSRHGASRGITRVPKAGGAASQLLDSGVRDAPVATHGGELLFFDDARPALRARRLSDGVTRTLSEHALFERPIAIAVDDDGVFVATGDGAAAAVVTVPLDTPR
jgi:hypothetical protein